ncbi:hypothetical protein ABK040_008824 [Willaertia magna]
MSAHNIIFFVALLIAANYYYQSLLPSPEPQTTDFQVFSEERALNHLNQLSKNIGVRLFGTTQEKRSTDYIVKTIRKIISENKSNSFIADLDIQNISNDVYLEMIDRKIFTSYSNVTNVIVKLMPIDKRLQHDGLLLSAHFDSGVTSPGFYDDGIPVVVMIETFSNIIQHLRKNKVALKRPLIFLFNGAEEVGLLGSHAFLFHPTFKNVKYFLNLEAAGSGGKEVLFQSNDLWLLKQFSKSLKRPNGNVIAQDIFQTNIIPSQTDFLIFTTKGNLKGIDISFYKNGYVYHTSLDSSYNYNSGSIQHMGTNVQSFVFHFSNISNINNEEEEQLSNIENPIYFDLFGLIMIVYDMELARLINTSILVIVGAIAIHSTFRDGALTLFDTLASLFCLSIALLFSILVNLSIALVLNTMELRMLYYSFHPIYPFVMYGCFSLLTYLILFKFGGLGFYTFHFEGVRDGMTILWITFLALTTKFGSSYLFMIVCICMALAYYTFRKVTIISYLFISIAISVISSIESNIIDMFIPMTGRMGKLLEGDIAVAMLISLLIFLIISIILPLLIEKINPLSILITFLISITLLLILIFTNTPYSYNHPKRLSIQHIYKYNNNNNKDLTLSTSYVSIVSPDTTPEEIVFKNSKKGSIGRQFFKNGNLKPQVVRSVISPKKYKGPFLTLSAFSSNTQSPPFVLPNNIEILCESNKRIRIKLAFDEEIFHTGIHIYTNSALSTSSFQTDIMFSRQHVSDKSEYSNEYLIWHVFGYDRGDTLISKRKKVLDFWFEMDKSGEVMICLENVFIFKTSTLTLIERDLPNWTRPISTSHSLIELSPFVPQNNLNFNFGKVEQTKQQ